MEALERPQMLTHVEKDLKHTLFDCRWMTGSSRLIGIGAHPRGGGTLRVLQMRDSNLHMLRAADTITSLRCCTLGHDADATNLATGDFEGKMQIWGVETFRPVYTTKEHKDMINCIDGIGGNTKNCGAPELVTGSRDGSVKVWDPRQNDRPVVNMEPCPGEVRRDCWTVVFGNSSNNAERVVCAGYDNGDVKMFDLRTMTLRWECNLKNGVCSIEFDRKDIPMNKMIATTLEGKFHVFDLRTQHSTRGFAQVMENENSNGTIWLSKHLPQNRDLFVTCSGSGHVSLWKYSYPDKRSRTDTDGSECGVAGSLARLQKMSISSQPINSWDWCTDMQGLAVCTSFDQHVRIVITTKLNLY